MSGKHMRFAAAAAALAAFIGGAAASPPLSVIQDTLYKADGSRFDGIAVIEWRTFQASDGSEVPQNIVAVRVANGALRVSLVPTTNASKPAYYTVRFNAEGRTQFTEFWSVPASAIPLRLMDIRTHGPVASPIVTPPSTIAIQDIAGLRTELDLRVTKGTNWTAGRAAVIGAEGAVQGAVGANGDCLRIDGTSGPCGAGVVFVDGETPAGTLDGVNTVFTLSAAPSPAGGLSLFRNGLLLRQGTEYTLSGNTVTMAPGNAPAAGDHLQAWYRVVESAAPQAEVADLEAPQGAADGVNRIFTLSGIPLPASSVQVYRNGLLQKQGIDYTIAVNTVTFLPASTPQAGDILQVAYRK